MSVRKLALAIALAAIGLPTAHAAGDAAVESGAAASAASTPQDCAKAMARHDHGAEKGTPTSMSAKCAMAPGTPTAKAKTIRGHDHARFHKLM